MRHVKHRDAQTLLQLLDLDLQLLAQLFVERAERLIHQQHGRLENNRARNRDALLLATRQLARHALAVVLELHQRQCFFDLASDIVAGKFPHLQRKGDVLRHRHVRKERIFLKDHADPALVRRDIGQIARPDADHAFVRGLEPRNHHQQGGLAGSGWSEKREKLAGCNVERDGIHCSHLSVELRNSGDFNLSAKTAGRMSTGYFP
jgi:hypothetical protein